MMRIRYFAIIVAGVFTATTPAFATEGNKSVASTKADASNANDTAIPFADHGGVRDWRADGSGAIYIQDTSGQWYRAELFASAFDLPFVQFIGIDAGPTGTLDRFGAIYVDGQRYPFRSFVKVDGPAIKKHN